MTDSPQPESRAQLAGVQYLDELFSAIRDSAEQLATAESWLAKAEASPHPHWRMSFIEAARAAHVGARERFGDANSNLANLGSPDRLPSLLAGIPERLDGLRTRLEASEKRLGSALDRVLQTPRGQSRMS